MKIQSLDPLTSVETSKSISTKIKIGQRVEVKYDDNIWYKGTLVEYHKQTGEWVALFDADGEKTSINFPDGDVRLLD